jgi:hypothetical protein
MKKVFTLVAVAGMFTFVACGPSAAELEAKAKATADSIAAVEAVATEQAAAAAQAIADSTAAVAAAAAEEATKAVEAAASEAAAKVKPHVVAPKAKSMEQKVKEEAKQATGGRG